MTRVLVLLAPLAPVMAGCAAVGPSDIGEDQYGGTVCPAGSMINGMDIAACQAANWPAVKAGGIQFAIIKATEGNGSSWYYVNSRFAGDWSGSKAAGVVRGAYHYFHPELDGKAQADFMMSIINKDGGLQPGDMPPMLDWEEPQCCGSPLPAGCGSASPSCGTPVSTMQANGAAFVNEIKALTGRDTLIYTYPWVWTYVIGAPGWAANYPLDISSFNSCPYVPGPWSNWKIWQYNTCASVAGVSGICGSGCIDVDHFNGDMAAMIAWTAGGGKPLELARQQWADFDGDGRSDFWSANGNFDTWLSSGDATFHGTNTPPPAYCAGNAWKCLSTLPGHVIAGDFNGDGLSDFLSANGNFDVFMGQPGGTFKYLGGTKAPAWCSGGATGCLSSLIGKVIVGDFNGDGRTDFLSANGNFDAFLSNGDGTFTQVSTKPPAYCSSGAANCLSSLPNHILVGDFNGDGRTDFASANGNFDVFLANADGTFNYAHAVPAPSWCSGGQAANCLSTLANHVMVADFTGDGRTDFLSANGNFDLFAGQPDGSFVYVGGAKAPSWCAGGATGCITTQQDHTILGDFNGDGRIDFMSANGGFDVWLSNGDGTFTGNIPTKPPSWCSAGAATCLSTATNHVLVGDWDGDGTTDFASANGNLDVWLSNRDGTFRYAAGDKPPSWCPGGFTGCLNQGTNDVLVAY